MFNKKWLILFAMLTLCLNLLLPLKVVRAISISDNNVVLSSRLDYSSWCSNATDGNKGIRQAMRTVGYLVVLAKWLVPILLILFGMIDMSKVIISGDDKSMNKATSSLIKRFIASIVVFLIPTLMINFIGILEVTNGIEEKDNPNFGACTKCLFDPVNSCE